ncbi:MAG: phospholipid/cholesterol/gamma-HCH transport system substrate-binding protein [Thermoleophilaceae bacterium]|jgi:virulence factor Mce-like protein|nr:phospholipid/cholesterol/gamma-HCH transport system substrate-binding protein [Thermoleophilaceae bacterium]
MSRSRQSSSIAGSPILIGAVTALVSIVAIFLSYNANSGLPFVPSYRITVHVPDAAGLVEGNEVRTGGKRIGSVDKIDGKVGAQRPYAALGLKLDKLVEPLRDDTVVTVRPRSTLGLKYLEVVPGRSGKPLPEGGTLGLAHSPKTVELDEVFNTFDAATRKGIQETVSGLGDGVAGRGAAFNEAVTLGPQMAGRAERVFRNVADPATRLRRALQALQRVTNELAPVAPRFASVFDNANTTLSALAGVRSELGQVLDELPPTEATATDALRVARPLLHDTRLLLHDVHPGISVLGLAATRLHSALQRGIPVLRRASGLADRLEEALKAVDDLASDPRSTDALRRLKVALDTLAPSLRYVVPAQSVCNYIGLWLRNASSTTSEGDLGGTWVRTLVIERQEEILATDKPAPKLQHNPYPNAAGPGTHGECEAGNEPFNPDGNFGHPAGIQATSTENTNRNQGLLDSVR